MMNENNIPVSGIVMMIKNEDGSFSPIGMKNTDMMSVIRAFMANASEKEPFIRSNEKYIRKEDDNGVDSGR